MRDKQVRTNQDHKNKLRYNGQEKTDHIADTEFADEIHCENDQTSAKTLRKKREKENKNNPDHC